jgi:hypothetical protein
MKVAPTATLTGATPISVPHKITYVLRRTWRSADKKLLERNDTKPSVVAARKDPKNTTPGPDQGEL